MNTTTINALARKYKLQFDDVRGVITRLGAEPMGTGALGKNKIAFYSAAIVEPAVAEYAAEKFRKRAERKAEKLKKATARTTAVADAVVVETGVSERLDDIYQSFDRLAVSVHSINKKLDELTDIVKRIESSSVVSMEAFQP